MRSRQHQNGVYVLDMAQTILFWDSGAEQILGQSERT